MYKHSTTHRTLSRRLAALLAVLALLAALALPVYAEALEGAAQMQETVETDNNGKTDNKVETGSDVEPDDKSKTNEGTGTGADTDSEDTKDNDSPNPGANSTTPADNDPADNTAPYEEKTDLTEEDTADDGEGPADEAGAKETLFAADTCSEDETGSSDMSAPMAASNEGETTSFIPKTATIYFAVDSAYQDNYRVNLFVEKDGSGLNKDMSDTGKTITDKDGKEHKIFSVTLSQADYPGGGFDRLIFQYFEGTTFKSQFFGFGGENSDNANKYAWTSIDKIAGKMFDGQIGLNQGSKFNESQWTRVEYYYKDTPLYFKNASDAALTNVTATFYKLQDGTTAATGSQTIGTVDAGKLAAQQIRIPDNDSRFVKFTWGKDGQSALYDFTTDYTEDSATGAQKLDLTTANCYVYNNGTADSWASAGADLLTAGKMIYFDSTFSSYAYAGENTPQNAMPKTNDDGNAKMYCFLQKADGSLDTVEMTSAPDPNALGRQLWSCKIPSNEKTYTAVQFSATNDQKAAAKDDKTKVYSTANIPPTLQEPCFFADNGDPTAYTYTNDDVYREGYWGEKSAVRDAESGKGTTVVDIDNTTPFVRNSATKYVTTTLYDYYTDWELNGNNRDKYNVANGMSQRNWVTFRQFDQALSDYYIAYNNTNKEEKSVAYPIYTGHFQPEAKDENGNTWGCPFKDVANSLNLYGYNESDKNKFMAVNNSTIDVNGVGLNNGETRYYDDAFQGLTGDELVNGEPVLYNTKLTVPYFNKDFLEGANSKKAVLGKVYENVDFPFTKEDVFGNGINYWHYESNDKSLFLKQKEGTADQYFLQQPAETVVKDKMVSDNAQNVNSSSGPLGTYGFFPFNEGSSKTHANTYNYGFGAKLQFDFTLTDDGQVLGNNGKVPIQFFFSGDDDVWVYIDDKLALDVGGDHGKVSGLLEFGLNSDKKLVYTPYVSDVKASNADRMYTKDLNCKSVNYREADKQYKTRSFNYKGNQKEISAGKHTLKFFYMERGMWESNMAIAFNFPDHNELQVEKKVDLGDVKDPEFAACFTNQKLFNFTILNQATHYGTTLVDKDSVQPVEPITLSSNDYTLNRMGNLENNSNNYCQPDEDPAEGNTGQVIHWYAEYDDTHSDYRKERMGVITLNNSVDITGMDYLSFYIYASGKKGEGTLSLSNMYLQLVDRGGNVLGCNDKESLSGTTYNQVDLKNDEWIKIKLDLSRLNEHGKFDKTKVVAIRIGDNFQRDIYFKDFTFTANPTIKKITGFTTEQKDIPDYGSAADGKLKLAESAQFSSSIDGKTRAVDENGQFTLQDKEVVTFSDQFRRGSYLSVTEDADAALFDTTWTIYENGVPVKTMAGGKTVTNANQIPDVVKQRGYTPNDGRTENVVNDAEQADNKYKKAEKPAGDKTIVFRSYTNPDAGDAAELTKLKLQFVNKVKTGSLTIKKEAAAGEQQQIGDGEYTFTVTFTDVGGLGLESKPIVKTVTIKGTNSETIYGIPVGTRFHIVETSATNKANVSGVTVFGGGSDCKVVNGKEAIGSIVEYKQADPSTVAVATFTNTTRTLIDIDLTKQWVDADNEELPDVNLPKTIYVQLQRKTAGAKEWTPVQYPEGGTQNYVAVDRNQGGWTHTFANLDADDYTVETKPKYQYRVVEGTLSADGKFEVKDTLLLSDGHTYTYEDGVMKSTTAGGKTSNTITLINKRLNPKFTLDITKADAENGTTPLKDVEFTLEKLTKDDNGNTVADASFGTLKGKTNGQGKLVWKKDDNNEVEGFTELEAGTYRLTETKAAKDYNLLSAPIVITFTKDGQCQIGNDTPMQAAGNTIFTGDAATGYTLKLTVLNRKTPALPHTGADAPSLWLLIGLPLAVAGLLILVFRYNKKGGRTR